MVKEIFIKNKSLRRAPEYHHYKIYQARAGAIIKTKQQNNIVNTNETKEESYSLAGDSLAVSAGV
jgi:hypothetical protein